MSEEKLVGVSAVAEAIGTRPSTIQYYTDMGLLEYTTNSVGRNRFYDINKTRDKYMRIQLELSKGVKLKDIIAKNNSKEDKK